MIEISPLDRCNATVSIPSSKSFTHRALVVSALAEGESILENALLSEDTEFTKEGLKAFGVTIRQGTHGVSVVGTGGHLKGGERIFVGNSGTSIRFLCALASLKKGKTLLDGCERMRKRPMDGLLETLNTLGVAAYAQDGNGCPPVIVESRGIKGGVAEIRSGESSQFLSALLMAAPYAEKDVCLNVVGPLSSRPYVAMTMSVMSAFGVKVDPTDDGCFFVKAGQRYIPRTYRIEGDASNASYFFSAAALTGGKVKVENFAAESVQGDSAFLSILETMGCHVVRGDGWAEVRGDELHGIEINMNAMPDVVTTLAITAGFAKGTTLIKDIGHLRLKESDRITALARGLSELGVRVEEGKDWLRIEGGKVHGGEIETYDDHRLAMSFAIAGLMVPGIKIKNERCVDKSFPGFWETFQKLY